MIRCTRCNRPMAAATAAILTRGGVRGYGPKCARLMGLVQAKPKTEGFVYAGKRWREADEAQMALEGMA